MAHRSNVTRITVLTCCLLAAVGFSATGKINVLFIAIDDLRPDIGCYENGEARTPHLDQLASEGILFSRAYCQQAVCTVSRLSLMTSVYPASRGFWDMNSRDEHRRREAQGGVTSLTEPFITDGYRVIGYGKIIDHRMDLDTKKCWDNFSSAWGRPQFVSEESNRLFREARKDKSKMKFRPATECVETDDDTYNDGVKTTMAVGTIERHDFSTPLFLAVGYCKPHLPFVAPRKYWDLYERGSLSSLAPRRTPPVGCTEYLFSAYKEIKSYAVPDPVPEDIERKLRHGYLACASYVDAQIGRLVTALKAKGVYKNTAIVIWGDHGFKLGDFGEWAKHTNLETDTRVPLIFKLPGGVHGGQKTDALAELVDLAPTLCEVAGLPVLASAQGHSLLPVMQNHTDNVREFAFSQYGKPNGHIGYSIRTENWRYHEVRHKRTAKIVATELYDLSESLFEQKNIIADYPEVAAEHAAKLDEFLKRLREKEE